MSDEELHEIAQALEPHLPGWSLEWDPANRPRYALFTNGEGAGMYVELSRRTDPPRLVVHGRYFPSYYPEPRERPRITLSSARSIGRMRSIRAIAADIQRRFIPHYLEAFARVCERKRRAEERERQEAAIRKAFPTRAYARACTWCLTGTTPGGRCGVTARKPSASGCARCWCRRR